MRPLHRLGEVLPAPSKKKDIARIAGGLSIIAAEFAYKADGGSYDTPRQAFIYTGLALALGLVMMPVRRFGENYYGNLRYKELKLSDLSGEEETVSGNGSTDHTPPMDIEYGDLD